MSISHSLHFWEADSMDEPAPLTSPFEDWCETMHVSPETFGAWESFQAGRLAQGPTDPA